MTIVRYTAEMGEAIKHIFVGKVLTIYRRWRGQRSRRWRTTLYLAVPFSKDFRLTPHRLTAVNCHTDQFTAVYYEITVAEHSIIHHHHRRHHYDHCLRQRFRH